MSSLYVKDLHADITETILFEKFSQFGTLISIRICQDLTIGKTLGYAYINFQNSNDAKKALEALNYNIIKGQPIKIMFSHTDISEQKSSGGHIYISNIHESVRHKEFYELFVGFGNILSCRMFTNDSGQTNGSAYVHYDTEESAKIAATMSNGKLVHRKKLYVRKFHPKFHDTQYTGTGTLTKYRNVYVKNFGRALDDKGLYKLFEPYGEITSAKVMMDDMKNASKGFGFVCYETSSSAEAAVAAMNGYEYDGRKLYCGPAMKKNEREMLIKSKLKQQELEKIDRFTGPTNIYVNNLDDSFDSEKLKEEFSSFGEIISSAVMMDKKGASKGYGFVCYSNIEEANRAINEMDGKKVGSRTLFVELASYKNGHHQQQRDRSLSDSKEPITSIGGPSGTVPLKTSQLGVPPSTSCQSGYLLFPVASNPQPIFPPQNYSQLPRPPAVVSMPYPFIPNGLSQSFRPPPPPPNLAAQTHLFQTQMCAPPESMGFNKFSNQLSNLHLTTSDSSVQSHKLKLREVLYPLVYAYNQQFANQITTILLELKDEKLQHLIYSKRALKAKVDEVLSVIQSKLDTSSEDEEDSSDDN